MATAAIKAHWLGGLWDIFTAGFVTALASLSAAVTAIVKLRTPVTAEVAIGDSDVDGTVRLNLQTLKGV